MSNNLNIFNYLIYIEILIILLAITRSILNFVAGIVMAIFKIHPVKQDNFAILTEIPVMVILVLTATNLAYIITADDVISKKALYYGCALICIIIFRIEYQKDIYELASKEGNIFLQSFPRSILKFHFGFT